MPQREFVTRKGLIQLEPKWLRKGYILPAVQAVHTKFIIWGGRCRNDPA